mmetsp:Transcript_115092/g.325212  ORF Transcript_115092/g.325212 Transcript_115092/m.325212 type:complete len:233 (+) Transcript_115092:716-1414(+)
MTAGYAPGSETALEVKLGILQDKLQDRAAMGLGELDAKVVLASLKANAWSEYSRSGTMRYYQVATHVPAVWRMVESRIATESVFATAIDLAAELDRPSHAGHMTYREETNLYCLFDSNRNSAVEVLQGVVRVGAKLAGAGFVQREKVLGMLPRHFDAVHCNGFVEQALELVLNDVDPLLPYLSKLSHDFLERLLRMAPRLTARKIARHVFRNEASMWPSVDMLQAIRELHLI